MYDDQNKEHHHNIKVANKAFKNVIKYLGTTITNQIIFAMKLRTD
jgi:hypothetical protein